MLPIQPSDFKPVAVTLHVDIGSRSEPLWDQFRIPTYGLLQEQDAVRFLVKDGRWFARCQMCATDIATCLEARTDGKKVTATSFSMVKQHARRRYHWVAKLNYMKGVRDTCRKFAGIGDVTADDDAVDGVTMNTQGHMGDAYHCLVQDIKRLTELLSNTAVPAEEDMPADTTPSTYKSLSRIATVEG
jgi:hypothetical protein